MRNDNTFEKILDILDYSTSTVRRAYISTGILLTGAACIAVALCGLSITIITAPKIEKEDYDE